MSNSEPYPNTRRLIVLLSLLRAGRPTVINLLHRVEEVYEALPQPSMEQLDNMWAAYEAAGEANEFGRQELQ
ncbi:hypothetical protein FRB99_008022, partial [Tulasnella sp. 403]